MAAVRTGKTMAVLKKTELVKARKLWEEVFEEDTAKFLDYYEIYVADQGKLSSSGTYAETPDGSIAVYVSGKNTIYVSYAGVGGNLPAL